MSFIPFVLASLRLATQTQAAENTHTVGPITVKVEGVCKIDDATLSCWTPKGESSPSIAEKVSAYYKVYDYDLPLKMGVKNRYLVVSETDSRG
ncbi:MAG: hypothetical protein ABUL49_00725, partial [bacterium]